MQILNQQVWDGPERLPFSQAPSGSQGCWSTEHTLGNKALIELLLLRHFSATQSISVSCPPSQSCAFTVIRASYAQRIRIHVVENWLSCIKMHWFGLRQHIAYICNCISVPINAHTWISGKHIGLNENSLVGKQRQGCSENTLH